MGIGDYEESCDALELSPCSVFDAECREIGVLVIDFDCVDRRLDLFDVEQQLRHFGYLSEHEPCELETVGEEVHVFTARHELPTYFIKRKTGRVR